MNIITSFSNLLSNRLFAQYFGFTQEELDFIINYDIKYRMGKELDSEEAVE
jgi:hypothetical protein